MGSGHFKKRGIVGRLTRGMQRCACFQDFLRSAACLIVTELRKSNHLSQSLLICTQYSMPTGLSAPVDIILQPCHIHGHHQCVALFAEKWTRGTSFLQLSINYAYQGNQNVASVDHGVRGACNSVRLVLL